MASCSTSSAPSINPFPELLSKLRPFELSSHESCFSDDVLDTEYNKCLSSELESLAAKDKKLSELRPFIEAQKRIKSTMRSLLKEEAEQVKKSLGGDEDDEVSEEEESEDGDSENEEIEIPVFVPLAYLDKAALTKLEVRSFVFKIWLRQIQLTRKEDQEKYNSLQDFEHAIHNAQEAIKQFRDFIYKCYNDSEEDLREMIPYYEERLEKASSKTFAEKEKASFEMTEEDVAIFCSHSARISALLGLKIDFLDRFEEIPPEDLDHLTLCDWIVTFLGNNYESVSLNDKIHGSLSVELLAAIGFDPLSSAVETIMARAGNTQQHIEACEMAEFFIKDEFKYNLLLSPLAGRFPLQSNLTNTWFQLPGIIDDEEKESNEDLCHVNIRNLVTEESRASKSMLSDLVSEDEQNIILFHGTDHKSATDILFRGIDLCAGRQKRDFSCGSGFYLTNNFDEALNWAKCTTSKPAMLVFQVNREQYLDNARKLDLEQDHERWYEIVSSFRSGIKTAKTRKSLGAYDLIEGPVATVRKTESGDLMIEPKPSSYQMCLISDDFADEFRQTLHSIVFMDSS